MSARSGRTSPRQRVEVDRVRDRRVELVGHRLLHGRARGDRRHGVHVAVGVQHGHARPDRDRGRPGEPAAKHEQEDGGRTAQPGGHRDAARGASSCPPAAVRSRLCSCATSSGATASAMAPASPATGVAPITPGVIRLHPPRVEARGMSNLDRHRVPRRRDRTQRLGRARPAAKEKSIVLDDMVVVERRPTARSSSPGGQPDQRPVRPAERCGAGLIGLIFLAPLLGMAGRRGSGGAAAGSHRRRRRRQVHEGARGELEDGRRRARGARAPEHARTRCCRGSRSTAARSSSPRSTTRPESAAARRRLGRPGPRPTGLRRGAPDPTSGRDRSRASSTARSSGSRSSSRSSSTRPRPASSRLARRDRRGRRAGRALQRDRRDRDADAPARRHAGARRQSPTRRVAVAFGIGFPAVFFVLAAPARSSSRPRSRWRSGAGSA